MSIIKFLKLRIVLNIFGLFIVVIACSPSQAAELDLSRTRSTGCPDQWDNGSECSSNKVWGAEGSLAIATCGTGPGLWLAPTATEPTAVGFHKEPLDNATEVHAFVTGTATANTKVKWQVRYFNSNNAVVGSGSKLMHSGSARSFSASRTFSGVPTNATKFSSRLVAENGELVVYKAGCAPSEEGLCYITCYDDEGNTYEVQGFQEGGACTAECPPGECDPETWPEYQSR